MSRINNPDNDVMTAQQERDLRHSLDSQPELAKKSEGETAQERLETDLIANEGLGGAFLKRRKSETEQALERARQRARNQAPSGRRRSQ